MIETPEIGMTFRLHDSLSEAAFIATKDTAGTVAYMVDSLSDLFYYRHIRLNGKIHTEEWTSQDA